MFEDATPRRRGPPTLRREPSLRAVPTTPMDRDGLGRLAFPVTWQPSPTVRRVGVHHFTFEACSGFTHVTARTVAGTPFACLDPKASARPVTPPHRLGGYRGEPKTPRTDLSSAGPLHPRGALTVPNIPISIWPVSPILPAMNRIPAPEGANSPARDPARRIDTPPPTLP
jgi:hypothetical protein